MWWRVRFDCPTRCMRNAVTISVLCCPPPAGPLHVKCVRGEALEHPREE